METVLRLEPGDGAAAMALSELRAASCGVHKCSATDAGVSQLAGAFQPGRVVPSAAKPAPLPFAAPAGPQRAAVPAGDQHKPGESGLVVGEDDFHRVSTAATSFLDRHAEVKQQHEDKQPPKPPPTRAEIEYPGMVFPPGFGPDAPDWDPTYNPSHFGGKDEEEAPSGAGVSGSA